MKRGVSLDMDTMRYNEEDSNSAIEFGGKEVIVEEYDEGSQDGNG